ncbi:cobalt transporter [Tetzosporium hominis]|uniref:Cobalt transporter n=1 Tax=Tetzosporium hominis TaxID=2020506 RepID=A0A264VZY4_9BACL|nr:energy-coupling factor transporter transmembrane component T [Tetzosporium hominis]OZS76898.1 cobalt transporter [Tetzosporium hominis]
MSKWLHRLNPSVKMLVTFVFIFALAFYFDPWTPLLMFGAVLVVQLLFSRIDWKRWLLLMLPFALGAIGYFWTTYVFGTAEDRLATALSLSFRVFAFSSLSLLFVLTTSPMTFIMSLMQQLKLSPKLAYSLLVGYQFLPVLKEEFIQIRQVQQLRRPQHNQTTWSRLRTLPTVAIPLLAGAVRKAEKTAFAMEARGFTGSHERTYFHEVKWHRFDLYFTALLVLIFSTCLVVGAFL